MDSRVAFMIVLLAGSALAWTHTAFQCVALLVFPVVCTQSGRMPALLFAMFFAAACLPVAWAGFSYTGSIFVAFTSYIALVGITACVFIVGMKQVYIPKGVALPLCMIVVSVPPLSFVNPFSLLPLAGWLFPGMGLLGIALLLVIVGISTVAKRWGVPSILAITALSLPISNLQANTYTTDITGANISRAYDPRLSPDVFRLAYRYEEYDKAARADTEIVVFPESVYGEWNEIDGAVLAGTNRTIYGGARLYSSATEYYNVVVNGVTGETVHVQRNPPLLLRKGAHRAMYGRGQVVDVGVAFLVCYELVNPVFASSAFANEYPVVWIANLSWFSSPYLEKRLISVLTAWSRLYSSSYQSAVLRHD